MARGQSRDLYLQVRGDISGLRTATQAGKTVLNEFSGAAINVLEEVEREMGKLGTAGLPNLKTVESAYTASFQRIKEQARAVIDAPTPMAAVQIIDAGAARQAASNATAQANALRLVAEAASRADAATGGTDAATRAFAASASAAAVNAEREAEALREQALVLGNVERQLGLNAGAQRKVVAVSGEARAGYQQLSFQLGDIATQYAAGTSASIIFAQQSGQVIQAISMIKGQATGFLGLLTGGWGIAIGAAAVALTPWIAKLIEGNNEVEKGVAKLRDDARQTEVSRQVREAFIKTIDGQIEAQRKLNDELSRGIKSQSQLDQERIASMRGQLSDQQRALIVAEARATRAATGVRQAEESAPENSRNTAAVSAYRQRVADARRELADARAEVRKAEQAISLTQDGIASAEVAKANRDAKALSDPLEAIKVTYQRMRDAANEAAAADSALRRQLAQKLAGIDTAERDAVAKEQKRQAEARNAKRDAASLTDFLSPVSGRTTGQFGERRPGHAHAGVDYAVPVGTSVRAPATGKVTAAGERGAYGNVIEINFGGGTVGRFAHLSKFNVKPGDVVNAGDVIGLSGGAPGEPGAGRSTGAHLHYEIRRNGKAVDPRTGRFPTDAIKVGDPTAAQRRVEQADDARVRNADEYASLIGRIQEQQVRLQRQRVTSIAEAANLDVRAVELAQADIERAADKGVELEKWTAAEAAAVKAVARTNAALEIGAIREEERVALAQRKFEIEQADLEDKVSILRLQEDLAGTAAERRVIARQLLAIEQQMVTDALKQRIVNEKDPDRRAQLQRRLDQVPAEYDLKGQQVDRQNQDPLQRYGQRLIDSTSDMSDALKGIAADGFGALEDASSRAAASAVTDLLKIRGVAGDVIGGIIADLARLAIQKAIVSAVGKSFFGLKDGGLLGFADGGLPGFAAGGVPSVDRGLIRGPGTGRSDSILALVGGTDPILVSNGEGIVNARAVQQYWPIIDAMNRGTFPRFADGGLVGASRVPSFPSIDGARAALQPANDRGPIRIVLAVTKGEAFAAEVLAVSAPATVEIIEQNMPAIANASAARALDVMGKPGL